MADFSSGIGVGGWRNKNTAIGPSERLDTFCENGRTMDVSFTLHRPEWGMVKWCRVKRELTTELHQCGCAENHSVPSRSAILFAIRPAIRSAMAKRMANVVWGARCLQTLANYGPDGKS